MTDITLTIKPEQGAERRRYHIACHVVYEDMSFAQRCDDLQAVAKEVLYFVAHHDVRQPQYRIAIAETGPRAQADRRELTDLLQNPLFKQQALVKAARER